jgi:inner membrane protein
MASPYGHALIGLSLLNVWSIKGPIKKGVWSLYGLAILGACLPDLDFLPGLLMGQGGRFHHGIIHSLGFVLTVSLLVWFGIVLFQKSPDMLRVGGLIFSLTLSHLILDYLTEAPKGFPLLWPFTEIPCMSPWPIFPRVERNWLHPQLWAQIRLCFLVETFLLVPLWMASMGYPSDKT